MFLSKIDEVMLMIRAWIFFSATFIYLFRNVSSYVFWRKTVGFYFDAFTLVFAWKISLFKLISEMLWTKLHLFLVVELTRYDFEVKNSRLRHKYCTFFMFFKIWHISCYISNGIVHIWTVLTPMDSINMRLTLLILFLYIVLCGTIV